MVRELKLSRSFEHVTKIICTKNDADQSNNLKVIRDLVITQSDEFEIFNDHLDQKRPRTFKIYGLEIET